MSAFEKHELPTPARRLKKSRPVEITALRVILAQREMRTADLAQIVGMSQRALSVSITRGVLGAKTRIRIEAALDTPIWSTRAEIQRRRERAALFGLVPELLTTRAVRRLAQKFGVPAATTNNSKAEIIAATERWLRARTTTPPHTKTNAP